MIGAAAHSAPSTARGGPLSLRDVRLPHASWIVAGAAAIAIAAYLLISRHFQFYYDEWDFTLHQPASAGAYFVPHNEHWSTVPLLIWQFLLGVFGMRTHVPFMATLIVMHALTCLVLFHIVRRRVGPLLAVCASLIVLVLGWGADDFLWAFQIGFEGSVLFGLIAIDVLDTRDIGWWRAVTASLLLLLSVASSGLGVAFVVAVAVELLLDPARRRRWYVLVVPVAAYLVWLAVIGAASVHPEGGLLSAASIAHFANYILYGAGSGASALVGAGQTFGGRLAYLALLLLAVLIVFGLRRGWDSRILGSLAGIVALFGSAGLVRLQIGVTQAGSRRYTYVAVIFLLLLGTLVVARLPARRSIAALLAAALLCGFTGNVVALRSPIAFWSSESARQDVELRTVNDLRGAADVDLRASPDSVLMPQVNVGAFYAAENRLGSPVSAQTLHDLAAANPALVDGVLRSVFQRAVRLQKAGAANGCAAGAAANVQVPSGGSLALLVNGSGALDVSLGWARAPLHVTSVRVSTGMWLLRVPDTGQPGFVWRVLLRPSAGLTVATCPR